MSAAAAGELSLHRATRPLSRRPATRTRQLFDPVPLTFALLAGYGVLRWQTLLPDSMRGRCVALWALSVAATVLARSLSGRLERRAARCLVLTVGALLFSVAMIPIAGLPLSWVSDLRLSLTGRTIGDAISALPRVDVPYLGGERAILAVIALGGGALMLTAALSLVTVERHVRERRLAAAAVPLMVLATLPSVLGRPQHEYLHGAILLAALVGFVFGSRIFGHRWFGAVAMLALAVSAGISLTVGLSPGKPWIDFDHLVGTLSHATTQTFDWAQSYGPLSNLGGSTTVLEIKARFPAYWKSENLDVFDGYGWEVEPVGEGQAAVAPNNLLAGVSKASARRWIQPLSVTVGAMRTVPMIVAGTAAIPLILTGASEVLPGASPGTWTAVQTLKAGDRYTADVYTPRPSARQLASAGTRYPSWLTGELAVQLPHAVGMTRSPALQFEAYPKGPGLAGGSAATLAGDSQLLANSPYAAVYRLAQTLRARTRSPYQYAERVLHYLQAGYTYVEDPPRTRYPIVGFLFDTKAGYCQQFAGAMALLLRMGGVPARVAVGFKTGVYDRKHGDYVVTAADAHAWVEAWFPSYGWVTFDPTPASDLDPNRQAKSLDDRAGAPADRKPGLSSGEFQVSGHHTVGRHARAGGTPVLPLLGELGALLAVLAGLAWGVWHRWTRGRANPSADQLVAELEAAFQRCGRPLRGGITLVQLERHLAFNPAAAEYVAGLRAARFGAAAKPPSGAGRRALRHYLRHGRGARGRLRALFSLPPWGLH